jgi:hypothetical protein
MKKCKHNLHITSLTWPKESNELFDYESQEVTKQEFNISTPCSFFRNKNQIDYQGKDLNETVNPIQQGESLFYIDNSLTDFYFNTHSFSTNSNLILDEKPEREKTWISLKNFKNKKYNNNGYILNPGDVIKFGRVTLKVREIQLEGRKKGNGNIYDLYKDITKPCLINSIKKEKNNKKKKICRICYCDEKEVDSPLLNPCKCLGGLKYIHLSCLQQWLKSKSTFSSSSNDYCTIYTFNQIACELCKQVFPDFIKVEHTFYQIWDFSESKFKNYISLDTLPLNGQKSIYIISFDKKNEIKIGRSHESDLRITDVTVSRMHCQITKTNENEVVLEDCNSKFGSLVFLQIKKLRILPHVILPIQIGRTFLNFSLRNTFNICNCLKFFDKKKYDNIDDYAKINSKQITIENILSVKIQNNLEDSEDNSSNEEKKEKDLPKEIIIKEEEKEENILNLTNEKQIDEINTLNLASLEIKKKNNQNITNTNGFSDDDRIISGTKSQFGNSCFQSFQNVINHIEQQ